MTNNENHHYNKQLPRLTKKRTKCQAMSKDGTKCHRSAKIEIAIHQDGFDGGKLWVAVFLCSGCAIRDIKTFFKDSYEHLLEQEEWAKSNRKTEVLIGKIKKRNEKAKKHNELVRAYEAGEISLAQYTKRNDAIYPEMAAARVSHY